MLVYHLFYDYATKQYFVVCALDEKTAKSIASLWFEKPIYCEEFLVTDQVIKNDKVYF
jgi:hypothetical protein